MKNNKKQTCPVCGNKAKSSLTQYGVRNQCCGLWSWGDKPLVDAETHNLRRAAHSEFDELWKSGRLSRGRAYKILSEVSGWPEDECHMAHMPKEKAALVPDLVRSIWVSLGCES